MEGVYLLPLNPHDFMPMSIPRIHPKVNPMSSRIRGARTGKGFYGECLIFTGGVLGGLGLPRFELPRSAYWLLTGDFGLLTADY